jgi:hypothetical protein
VDNVVGALAIRMFAAISPTSQYRQQGRISLKISGKGSQSLSHLVEDRVNKVSGSAPRHLYHRRKQK